MKRNIYSAIVIGYALFNIVILIYFQAYENKSLYKESDYSSESKGSNLNEELDKDEVMNSGDLSKLEIDKSDNEFNRQRTYINNNKQEQLKSLDEISAEIAIPENLEFDSYNKKMREQNKVMRVSTDEIIDNLTTVEKGKIMILCKELDDEDYNNINKYLSYTNEKLGVKKTLDVLEKKVDKKKIDEVKKIFSKYIDMDKVEKGD
ncbi:MAG: hypothetical protein RSA29_17445 [Clostridium sp.]|uniref:hypothetical protein n=1 Tax=Clostridium sp. TaxID=1506 RepID=UPI00303718C4